MVNFGKNHSLPTPYNINLLIAINKFGFFPLTPPSSDLTLPFTVGEEWGSQDLHSLSPVILHFPSLFLVSCWKKGLKKKWGVGVDWEKSVVGGFREKLIQGKMKLNLNLYIFESTENSSSEFPKKIKQLGSIKNKFANGVLRFCRNFDALNTSFEIFGAMNSLQIFVGLNSLF